MNLFALITFLDSNCEETISGTFCVMRHSYSDAQKLRRFMHDSELGHSQALQFFNVSLLTDDFEHKSKCILQITLSTPPIHYLLID